MEDYKRILIDDLKMSEVDADSFLSGFKIVEYKKGGYLLSDGDNSSILRIVLKGCARGYAIMDGKEITTNFYFEHDHAYDYINYLLNKPAELNIQALDSMQVIEQNLSSLDFLATDNYGLYKMGIHLFRMNVIWIESERRNFIIKSPKERYLHLLKNNKQIISRVPQHQIASYIGISAEHLSRIRKEILN